MKKQWLIEVEDIEEGKRICFTQVNNLNEEFFEGIKNIDFRFVAPLEVDIYVYKNDERVFLEGMLKSILELRCVRCLENFPFSINSNFHYTLLPVSSVSFPEEMELTPEDLEIEYFDGKQVDLFPLVREQVILAVPLNPLCKDTCKGLCPICGENLNINKCSCLSDKELKESPFSKLKILFHK